MDKKESPAREETPSQGLEVDPSDGNKQGVWPKLKEVIGEVTTPLVVSALAGVVAVETMLLEKKDLNQLREAAEKAGKKAKNEGRPPNAQEKKVIREYLDESLNPEQQQGS